MTDDIPSTIPAVLTRAGGPIEGPDSLVDATIPTPAAPTGHDLLVKLSAISVNPVDAKIRVGGPGDDDDKVLGWDAAGVVVATGPDTHLFHPGDKVYYAGSVDRPGCYQRFQLVDERIVGHQPHSLNDEQAAVLPLTGLTAWEGLFDKFGLDEFSSGTLLVIGAGGGVGSMVIQLAKALTGLTVIATASRPESKAWAGELGADHVVNYREGDLAEQVLAIAPDGVDHVYSTRSQGMSSLLLDVTRPFGHILLTDEPDDMNYSAFQGKALSCHWEFMFARPVFQTPDMVRQHEILDRIAELVDDGKIRTTLTKTLGPVNAQNLRAAHEALEDGHVTGKIALTWTD
ncbi:zinc-binding alcohol dehydrogenase family protein [Propionibacterium sp.]|uniref:zinc-binding alcohol dehydrogenase family protein n=1 Tax=Propionibacterium sp. TaxID=1977903 RepID=UPI0039EBE5C2